LYKFGQNFYTSIGKYWTFIFLEATLILPPKDNASAFA
jgi:hypothetical protein